jgi:hypothetical protein
MTPLECVFIVAASIFLFGVLIAGISIWVYRVTTICLHTYKRIDDCNDKKMVLVCQRCGKIKRLRK